MSDSRPELTFPVATTGFDVVEKPLSAWEKFYNNGAARKILLLALLALIWEVYARWLNNPLLFPTFSDTVKALATAIASGEIPRAASYSVGMLLKGYVIGLLLAGLLTAFASAGRLGSDLLETLTAMFNPLPSIALLPLALIWFGLGEGSVIFVLIHAVLWSVALNMHSGFRAVSPTLKMVGQNYGLSKSGYVIRILLPAAFPSILDRSENRMGVRLAHPDRSRTGVRGQFGFGGPGMVHLRAKESAAHPQRFCRASDRDPVRPCGGEPDLQNDRERNGAAMGHAELIYAARTQADSTRSPASISVSSCLTRPASFSRREAERNPLAFSIELRADLFIGHWIFHRPPVILFDFVKRSAVF